MTTPKPKKKRAPVGLRQRLLVAVLQPLMAVFLVSVFLDYRLAEETASIAYDQSLADAVLDLAAHIQSRASSTSIKLSAEAEAMLRNDPSDKIYFAVRDATGKLLAGDSGLPISLSTAAGPRFIDSTYLGRRTRAAVYRIADATSELTITVAETTEKRDLASQRILTAMVLPNLIVILATFMAVFLGVRSGLKPLEQIEDQIASRSPRDLRELEVDAAPREIRPLLSRLNELFGLLRQASAAQQHFLADAAHQLRTPLAGLQAQLDLATVEGEFAPNSDRLARLQDATERIGHLVKQLLMYARAEPSAALGEALASVSLHDLAERSASVFIDRAVAKGIDLGFDLAAAETPGIPWMLREALANLIDNALHYTPANGVITVSSGIRDGCPCLEVEDNGPGIPDDQREKVFERFYRIPGSNGDGCGLGLAIVREVADYHVAKIKLSTPSGGGLRISLIFPQRASTPLSGRPFERPMNGAGDGNRTHGSSLGS